MGKDDEEFPPLFTSAEDWTSNACLNYSHDPLELYTLGYKKAADHLVKKIIDGSREQDILVYPIVFLYRQYIELRFKEIIREGNILLEKGYGFPQHHRIQDLWPSVKSIFRKVFQEKYPKEFKLIEHIVAEFDKVDPLSFSFRYPTAKNGQNLTERITHINVRHLGKIMGQAAEALDTVSFAISVYRDQQNEFKNSI